MSKILSTLVLTLGLLFGGMGVVAPAAVADDCVGVDCSPQPEPCLGVDCPAPPEPCVGVECGPCTDGFNARLVAAEQTVHDYRQQIAALTARVEAQQHQLDRQARRLERKAATIQRLRAKIRRLR